MKRKRKKDLTNQGLHKTSHFDFAKFIKVFFRKENIFKKTKQKKLLLSIFLLSFIFSIIVLFTGKNLQPIKQGNDDYYYFQNAVRVQENILKSPVSFILDILSNSFSQSDYVKMGFIENDIDSVFRAPFFIFFWAFVFLIFGSSVNTIWIFNSIIFATSTTLFFILANKLYGDKKINLILTFIFIIYPGFHIIKIFMNTEPLLNLLLLLLIICYINAINKKKPIYYFLTGMFIYLSALVKLSIQYLGFLLMLFIIYNIIKTYRLKIQRRIMFLAFISGIIITMLPWKFICYRSTGSWDLLSVIPKNISSVTAGRASWQSSDPYCHGLSPDSGRSASIFFRESINKVQRNNNLWFYYSNICGKAVESVIKKVPITFIKNSFKKAIFLLISPPSENIVYLYKFKLIIQPFLGLFYFLLHSLIVLLAMISVFFPYKGFNKKVILIFIVFYHLGLHGFSHIESRYLDSAMPSMMLLAGATLGWKRLNIKNVYKRILVDKKIKIFVFSLMILLAVIVLFNYQYISFMSVSSIYVVRKILLHLLVVNSGIIIFFLSKSYLSNKFAALSSSLLSLFFLVTINVFPFSAPDYDQWSVTLNKTNLKVKQKIFLKNRLDLTQYDQALIAIDCKIKGDNVAFKVKLNDMFVNYYTNDVELKTNILYYLRPKNYVPNSPSLHRWLLIEIDKNLLADKKVIDIEIIPELKNDNKCAFIIYGDYETNNRYFIGPSFFRTFRSIMEMNLPYLLKEGIIDTRHIEKMNLDSLRSHSYFIRNNIVYSNDLSNNCGKQYGQYRIRLLLKRMGGYYINERYSNIKNYYFGFVGLFRPLENRLVEWLPSNRKGYIPAPNNVRIYLQTEYDRYYSGYEIY